MLKRCRVYVPIIAKLGVNIFLEHILELYVVILGENGSASDTAEASALQVLPLY